MSVNFTNTTLAILKSPPKLQTKSLSADYTDYVDWKNRNKEFEPQINWNFHNLLENNTF